MENTSSKNNNGMGIASMVCGIIALVVSVVPCVGLISFPIAILAIIFGCISYKQRSGDGQPAGMAIAGLVTSIFALIFAIAWIVAIIRASNNKDIVNELRSNWELSYEESSDDFEKIDTTIARLSTVLDSMDKSVDIDIEACDSTFRMSVTDENGKKVNMNMRKVKK